MQNKIKFLIGVDGGGSGTRIIISDISGNILAKGEGNPSALALGIDRSWRSIMDTIAKIFYTSKIKVPMLSECAIGLGLSGANNVIWKNEFLLCNPGFSLIEVDTDGFTTLMGAHQGKPGSIVALGTGSIGMILRHDNTRSTVSGWGFPSGDEASGSWLGLKAMRLAQKTLDKRRHTSTLSNEIFKVCGSTENEILNWLSTANQNTFATLAPLVFKTSKDDADAMALLLEAGVEVENMAKSLDPKLEYPLSVCGRLGEALTPYLNDSLKKIIIPPVGDSCSGALEIIKSKI
jgi:glucosamine kinase